MPISENNSLSWSFKFVPRGVEFPGLIEAGRYTAINATVVSSPHRHGPNRCEIIFIEEGQHTAAINEHSYTIHENQAVLILPNSLHCHHHLATEPARISYMVLDLPAVPKPFLNLSKSAAWPLIEALRRITNPKLPFAPLVIHLWQATLGELEQLSHSAAGTMNSPWKPFVLLAALLAELSTSPTSAGEPTKSPLAERSTHYVNNHLDEPVSIAKLSREAGISTSYFQSQFKLETGLSPKNYLLRHKISIAQDRLLNSSASITDIAFCLGFPSSQHFATVFKHFTGRSPSQFRAIHPVFPPPA